MDRAGGRPLWPTLIVLVGTVAAVALVLASVADRTPEPLAEGGDATAVPSSPSATSAAPMPTPQPSDSPAVSPSPSPSPSALPTPTTPPSDVPVDVLNQTLVEGLAGRAAAVLSDAGWAVGQIENTALGAPSTTVYVPTGLEDDADLLLDAFPMLTRTRPAFEGLNAAALTLVLAEPDAERVVALMEQTTTSADPSASPFALAADAPDGR